MFFSCFLVAEVAPDALQDNPSNQGLAQYLVNKRLILVRELGQRLCQFVGNGQLAGNNAGEVVLVRFGIEGLAWQLHWNGGRRQPHIVTDQRGDGQPKLIGQRTNALGSLIDLATFERPVSMQRNRPGYRVVRAEALAIELGIEFVIEGANRENGNFRTLSALSVRLRS
jgi:hypothetical protein